MLSRLLFLGFAMLLSWSVQAQFPCISGEISLANGQDASFCDDGSGEPFRIRFRSQPAGIPRAYVVVNDVDEIVYIGYSGNIDFAGLGTGLRVYSFSLVGSITAQVGDNLNDVELASGCAELSSNFIEIMMDNGGQVGGTLTGGPFDFCVGNFDPDFIPEGAITLMGEVAENSAWVITDADGNILGLPASPYVVDFDFAGGGSCNIYNISYLDGIQGLEMGTNIADLMGCFDLSNAVVVNRTQPDGGVLLGGPYNFCAGDGTPDMIPEGAINIVGGAGANFFWVVTDSADTIIGLPPSPYVVDFDGAGQGTCYIRRVATFNEEVVGLQLGTNLDDLAGCYDLSNRVTVNRTSSEAATLAGGPFTFCVGDGIPDLIGEDEITLSGNNGANSQWVITDANGIILGLPPSFSVVDFDGAGAGACLVYFLNYNDGLEGLMPDANIADLSGCFGLSNGITVNRNQPEGGTLEGGPFSFCVGDGVADMIGEDEITLTGNSGPNNQWVVTDSDGNILGLPPTFSAVDFDGAGLGACLVYHLSYVDGIEGLAADTNISELSGCFDLSNAITVNRGAVTASSLMGGPFSFCTGDFEVDTIPQGAITLTAGSGDNAAWVVTDADGTILGLPPSPYAVNFDFSGTGACLIYHLNYTNGLAGLAVDANISELDGCFLLSNAVTVNRTDPNAGVILGGPYTFCVGDGSPDMLTEGAINIVGGEGVNFFWIVTDTEDNIIGTPPSPYVVDFDGAGAGTCYIRRVGTFNDEVIGLEVGTNLDDIDDCFALSNRVTIIRNEVSGTLEGGTLEGGPFSFCVSNNIPDMIPAGAITLSGNSGTNSQWVVTDSDGNILGLPPMPSAVNFDGAGEGTCLIYHLSYEDGLTGLAADQNIGNLAGCFSLSNSIAVERTAINGGAVTTIDGETNIDVTVNDGIPDVIQFMSVNAIGENFTYIITDANNQVLMIPAGDSADFEGAGVGVCRVWGLAYTGELLIQPGDVVGQASPSEGCFAISDIFITVNRTEGFQPNVPTNRSSFSSAIDVQLYPNPATDQLQVNLTTSWANSLETDVEMMVIQMDGKIVYRNTIGAGQLRSTVDVSQLPAGSYFIRINDGQQIATKRFVKVD